MADAPVTVRANDDGGVTIVATCQGCAARHVVVIGNVGAFTRQTVVSILSTARLDITSTCARCIGNELLAVAHSERSR